MQCASYLERLDPSIYWMGMHHSRLVERSDDPAALPRIDPEGASVRLGHSVAFFIGTAYGSTETAERLARTVRAMHHTIKGTRPDGATYDADDPEWLRWNYATVVWGLATAHEIYHPRRCAVPTSIAITASSSGSVMRSGAPTSRPPRPRPSSACGRICRAWR